MPRWGVIQSFSFKKQKTKTPLVLCVWIFVLYVGLYNMCSALGGRRQCRSPGIRITEGCELLRGCCGSDEALAYGAIAPAPERMVLDLSLLIVIPMFVQLCPFRTLLALPLQSRSWSLLSCGSGLSAPPADEEAPTFSFTKSLA